jgi:hypothetical protein
MELSDNEINLLHRIARQKNLYLTFSIINVAVAVLLVVYYGLITNSFSSIKFALIILILLGGRAHLRQYRSAVLLGKLKIWLERKDA